MCFSGSHKLFLLKMMKSLENFSVSQTASHQQLNSNDKNETARNMETALDQVGGHGKFQIRTVFGLGAPCASMSCLWVMSLFWGQKPEHYCVNGTAVLIPCNISNTTNCDYVMETTYVTDFNLLCDNAAIFPAFQASWQVGLIFGEIFWGYLTDRIGRRKSILFSLFSLVVACMSYLISSTLTSFLPFLCSTVLAGFSGGGQGKLSLPIEVSLND